MLPLEPTINTSHLSGITGQIGPNPEDFIVHEIPKFSPLEQGPLYFVQMWKRQWPTPKMIRTIAKTANVNQREVGYAGMKDKYAITTQWISLPGKAKSPEKWQLPEGMRVLKVARASGKLRTGQLLGNQFEIRLINLDSDSQKKAEIIAEYINKNGIINSFGQQRFGHKAQNLKEALQWLEDPALMRLSRFKRKLYASVVQSEIFNQYCLFRAKEIGFEVQPGDVLRLAGTKSVFTVEDSEEDVKTAQKRIAARDVSLTGPIWGKKSIRAKKMPGLQEIKAATQVLGDPLKIKNAGNVALGARRDIFIEPKITIHSEQNSLLLSFALPPGSFATQVIREFTRTPWLSPARSS